MPNLEPGPDGVLVDGGDQPLVARLVGVGGHKRHHLHGLVVGLAAVNNNVGDVAAKGTKGRQKKIIILCGHRK